MPPLSLTSQTARSQVTEWTAALAKNLLAEGGGIVGLGRYVMDLATNAWGSCFAEVEVDMETGQVSVLRMVVAHEIGRVLYPAGAEGQMNTLTTVETEVEFGAVELIRTPRGCGGYDYRQGECFEFEGAGSEARPEKEKAGEMPALPLTPNS